MSEKKTINDSTTQSAALLGEEKKVNLKKKKILFVDDEPNVLQGLQRMLRPMRNEWEMAFVTSAQKALSVMAKENFDVMVSDMRMPGMDGASLLKEVMIKYPKVVRFALSGQSDQDAFFRSVGTTHQFLSKPCEPEILKATIERAFSLREIFATDQLNNIVSQISHLPCLPNLYNQVQEELQLADPSLIKVGQIIESDIGMSAKILQIVNSAFFGFPQKVSSPVQAVNLLGLETIRALILTIGLFSQSYIPKSRKLFLIEALTQHCIAVSLYAKAVAKNLSKDNRIADEAFTAGILHDAGKLILAVNFAEQYGRALALAQMKGISPVQAEEHSFGTTHAQVGAYLLGLWGLPDPIVEAVAFHHFPSDCVGRTFTPLTAVHIANIMEKETHMSEEESPIQEMDINYLKALGLETRLPKCRDICLGIQQELDEK